MGATSRTDRRRAVVLVEGPSDRLALERLAERRGRDLAADGVAIVAMGGVTNIGRHLASLAAEHRGTSVAGLYDVGETRAVSRQLERAGLGTALDPAGLEALGFFACDPDLEGELIRALGVESFERVVETSGELSALRSLQQQPAQVGRPEEAQLRRFVGTRGGRKIRYAPLLVDALEMDRVPRPLDAVLARV
ncbi:TOPRIM nucleotidyl transferase/hydrolase domain-containing protein [Beutenbergia cavernae]|uniref:TOPRIM nucleotidyl transferase/hydrolase domain-containing protein n=1 Tax=Beutenbergia cavernae TaxID=84757 RepID=UPI00019AC4C2|nr:ATP-dependent endonuclease [Beutenbergia cavernae]